MGFKYANIVDKNCTSSSMWTPAHSKQKGAKWKIPHETAAAAMAQRTERDLDFPATGD